MSTLATKDVWISGPQGSGKSTLARKLAAEMGGTVQTVEGVAALLVPATFRGCQVLIIEEVFRPTEMERDILHRFLEQHSATIDRPRVIVVSEDTAPGRFASQVTHIRLTGVPA